MVIPRDVTLTAWAASLIIDFPDDDIPLLYNEDAWRGWGNFLSQCRSFSKNGAPATQGFLDWNSWAERVFEVMANF